MKQKYNRYKTILLWFRLCRISPTDTRNRNEKKRSFILFLKSAHEKQNGKNNKNKTIWFVLFLFHACGQLSMNSLVQPNNMSYS